MISAMGICPVHKIDLLSIGTDDTNGQASCVKCRADSAPKTGVTQFVEDPGEAFFSGGRSNAKITVVPTEHGAKGGPAVLKSASGTLEEHIQYAIDALRKAPMPNSMKQYKVIQKVISNLESIVEQ